MTADEKAVLDARAAGAGMTVSEFVRQASLKTRVVVKQYQHADPRLLLQLVRIGSNLNQLTRIANRTRNIPPDLPEVLEQIQALVFHHIDQGHATDDTETGD